MAVIDTILKEQTYEVDAVSGATSTSEGIITGVRRALKEAEKLRRNEGVRRTDRSTRGGEYMKDYR